MKCHRVGVVERQYAQRKYDHLNARNDVGTKRFRLRAKWIIYIRRRYFNMWRETLPPGYRDEAQFMPWVDYSFILTRKTV